MEPRALGYAAPSTPEQYLTTDQYNSAYGGAPGPSPFANGQVVLHNGQNYVRIQSGHDQYGNPTYASVPYGAVNPGQAGPGQSGSPGAAGVGGASASAPAANIQSPSNPGGLTDPAVLARLAQGGGPGSGPGGVVGATSYGPTPGAMAAQNMGGGGLGNYMAGIQQRNAAMQNAPLVPGIGGGSSMPVHNVNSFATMLAGLKTANPAPMAAAPAAPGK